MQAIYESATPSKAAEWRASHVTKRVACLRAGVQHLFGDGFHALHGHALGRARYRDRGGRLPVPADDGGGDAVDAGQPAALRQRVAPIMDDAEFFLDDIEVDDAAARIVVADVDDDGL